MAFSNLDTNITVAGTSGPLSSVPQSKKQRLESSTSQDNGLLLAVPSQAVTVNQFSTHSHASLKNWMLKLTMEQL